MFRLHFSLGLLLLAMSPAIGQVRIHNAAVRLLAKPYGIEKRIILQSIDGLYTAADGSKRLEFTLRSSGVKEVALMKPVFSIDIILPEGGWASLGTLSGCGITFPVADDSNMIRRTYVAEFRSDLKRSDLEAYLRQAAASTTSVRLLGRAEMIVSSNGKEEFSKKNLKLELCGDMNLSAGFKAVSKATASQLPEVGSR